MNDVPRRKPGKEAEWEYYVDKKSKIAYVRLLQFNKPSPAELKLFGRG